MPDHLVKQIIQIVKLIRSKGVGLYFISQSPGDIPDEILAQLGNRFQHVLRSYTPSDEKVIKAASDSFRKNENFQRRPVDVRGKALWLRTDGCETWSCDYQT